MKATTTRQQELLQFIRSTVEATGKAPSYRAMAAHLGVSTNAAVGHVESLERKGLIWRNDGKITLTRYAR